MSPAKNASQASMHVSRTVGNVKSPRGYGLPALIHFDERIERIYRMLATYRNLLIFETRLHAVSLL